MERERERERENAWKSKPWEEGRERELDDPSFQSAAPIMLQWVHTRGIMLSVRPSCNSFPMSFCSPSEQSRVESHLRKSPPPISKETRGSSLVPTLPVVTLSRALLEVLTLTRGGMRETKDGLIWPLRIPVECCIHRWPDAVQFACRMKTWQDNDGW